MLDHILQIVHSAPAEGWLSLTGVIVGSLLTALGVALTNRSNAKQLKIRLSHEERLHNQRLAKERLEELYILIGHWTNLSFSHYAHLTLVMKGQTDYNQYLDSITSMKPDDKIDFGRLEMIVRIYGEQFSTAYDLALAKRDEVGAVVKDHKAAYLRGESGHKYVEPARRAQLAFNAACEALKKEIASTSTVSL